MQLEVGSGRMTRRMLVPVIAYLAFSVWVSRFLAADWVSFGFFGLILFLAAPSLLVLSAGRSNLLHSKAGRWMLAFQALGCSLLGLDVTDSQRAGVSAGGWLVACTSGLLFIVLVERARKSAPLGADD